MPSGTYGGVRGRKTKVGRKLLRFPPTRCNCASADGLNGTVFRTSSLLLFVAYSELILVPEGFYAVGLFRTEDVVHGGIP